MSEELKKKILVVHPEGNINNNPNLTGIVELLCGEGYMVEILSPRHPGISQKSPCPGAVFRLLDVPNYLDAVLYPFVVPWSLSRNPETLTNYIRDTFHDFDLAIGVDRGIIDAALISRAIGIPAGLISYEIYSAEETGFDFKVMEIEACRRLSFAVCQDSMRSALLGRENQIPPETFFEIPVSGRGFVPNSQRTFALHDHFGLSRETKIAAYIGSVGFPWAMIGELLETLPHWPSDWVLLLHHRYGAGQIQQLYSQFPYIRSSNKFYISPYEQLDFKDLPKILHEVDLGLAFYRHIERNVSAGNNLKYIGMASGKIATYLQHGLPIVINNLYPWNDMITAYNIGCFVDNLAEIPSLLKTLSADKLEDFRMNIPLFFGSQLDLNFRIQPLLQHIRYLLEKITV